MAQALENSLDRLKKWNLRTTIKSSYGYTLEDGMNEVVVQEVRAELSKYDIPRELKVEHIYNRGKSEVSVKLKEWETKDIASMSMSGIFPPSRYFRVEDWVDAFVNTAVEQGKGYKLREMLENRHGFVQEVIREIGVVRPRFFADEVKYFVDRLYRWSEIADKIENPEAAVTAATKKLGN